MSQPPTPAAAPLPDNLLEPVAAIRDGLQRIVEAVALPSELGRLTASAAALVPILSAAGHAAPANHLADSIRYMDSAAVLWSEHLASPTPASSRAYDDEVFMAFDCACWALDCQDPAVQGVAA